MRRLVLVLVLALGAGGCGWKQLPPCDPGAVICHLPERAVTR